MIDCFGTKPGRALARVLLLAVGLAVAGGAGAADPPLQGVVNGRRSGGGAAVAAVDQRRQRFDEALDVIHGALRRWTG